MDCADCMSWYGFCQGDCDPKTNADRIRSMSDEELAKFMAPYDSGCPRWKENPIPCTKRESCRNCWLDWLREECE